MSQTNGPQSSARGTVWKIRYRAYRHKYGRFKAFWRGIVLAELFMMSKGVLQDDADLMDHLITVGPMKVEFHFGDAPPEDHGNGRGE